MNSDPLLQEQKRWLVETYFSPTNMQFQLKEDQILLRQGERNQRIFYVLEGELEGVLHFQKEEESPLFEAVKGDFIGIQSSFHPAHQSLTTVICRKDATLAWLDPGIEAVSGPYGLTLAEQFMPVILEEWAVRMIQVQKLYAEKESMLAELQEQKRKASLGELSSGIAHELNNSMAVIAGASRQIRDLLIKNLSGLRPNWALYFERILTPSALSSQALRSQAEVYEKRFGLSHLQARLIVQAQSTPEEFEQSVLEDERPLFLDALAVFSRLRDTGLAATQSSHVVQSMRLLGRPFLGEQGPFSPLPGIRESIHLLQSRLLNVELALDFPDEEIRAWGNHGDLVQIMLNLMQNALEAMQEDQIARPRLELGVMREAGFITVRIRDYAGGIAPENLSRLFEPSFSTKKLGHQFGLGLGLSIVKSLIEGMGGEIRVNTNSGGSCFEVRLKEA